MKKFGANTLLVLGGMLVAALVAEAALRLVGFSYPSFHMYDPDLGTSLRPGAEGLYQREGGAYVKINSDGLRDFEHPITKPDNVFRIAILGDSYAEGVQLDIDKLFWKVMEGELQGCRLSGKRQVEAINFGVSGYGTARELLILRKKVWKYSPDMVILAFLTGNDVRDNSKELNRVDYVPYFDLNKKGELILDKDYLESSSFEVRTGLLVRIRYSIGDNVRLYQLARSVRHAWQQPAKNKGEKNEFGELGLDNSVYSAPEGQDWLNAWAVTEALLLQLNKEIKEKNSDFMLLTLSNAVQVHPDKFVRKKFMEKLKINDLFYPDKRIEKFAQGHDIDVLTLAPMLVQAAEENNIYMHGFSNTELGTGHWNANGHRHAGELVAQHLCR